MFSNILCVKVLPHCCERNMSKIAEKACGYKPRGLPDRILYSNSHHYWFLLTGWNMSLTGFSSVTSHSRYSATCIIWEIKCSSSCGETTDSQLQAQKYCIYLSVYCSLTSWCPLMSLAWIDWWTVCNSRLGTSFSQTEELFREKQRQRGKSSEADGLITMVTF